MEGPCIRLLTPALVAVLLAASTNASAAEAKADRCQTRSCTARVASKQCSQQRVQPCIRFAAMRWRVSHPLLKAIIRCESRFRPWVVNPVSGAVGLAQFLRSTWATVRPYAHRNPLRARWNSLGAAWLLRVSGTRPWFASQHCWG